MSGENTDDDPEDVSVEDDTVEEAEIDDVADDATVEEELEVDEEGDVTEEVTVEDEETGEETVAFEEDVSVDDEGIDDEESSRERIVKGRERLEEEADRAVDQFDEGIVDLLSWVLDTETRARIYVYLRQHSHSTSEEIAEGTGLYPSTVRESLAELHEEETVERRKRESEGAGNNPYEYTAIAPSDLVSGIVGQIQDELNTVFNLDDHLGPDDRLDTDGSAGTSEPVSIRVEDEESGATDEDRRVGESEGNGAADGGATDDG